jgi:uncharacterized protein (TIGR02246 family)
MKNITYFRIASSLLIALIFISLSACSTAPENVGTPAAKTEATEIDMSAVKAEIQAIEDSFAAAYNRRDVNAILALYDDDAVSMASGEPMLIGKAEIKKDFEVDFAEKAEGSTVKYEVLDVFGNANQVTETGKYTYMDAAGKATSTGKYMAIWEKRDGKYVCIRDIGNSDTKEY